ncbi:hypothetical protein RND81_10G166500 [Saponaria officinalis]|uniref:Lachrymatory factor synthase n=1 Tax=Saponaria officinalis TaxID=3572 RepID=A0AAW1I396_SAPOF
MEKWEAKVRTKLKTRKPKEIWALFKDFFNLHKYFPNLTNSYGLHGTNGEPRCIRYCLGGSIKTDGGDDCIAFSKERLLAIDDVNMSLWYEIVECNIGFEGYESTVRISPDDDDQGCMVEWGFSVEPVRGMRFDDLVGKYEVGLLKMVMAMEESLKNETV